jgi:hypothetical protein
VLTLHKQEIYRLYGCRKSLACGTVVDEREGREIIDELSSRAEDNATDFGRAVLAHRKHARSGTHRGIVCDNRRNRGGYWSKFDGGLLVSQSRP